MQILLHDGAARCCSVAVISGSLHNILADRLHDMRLVLLPKVVTTLGQVLQYTLHAAIACGAGEAGAVAWRPDH